jgi:hypothetical protein
LPPLVPQLPPNLYPSSAPFFFFFFFCSNSLVFLHFPPVSHHFSPVSHHFSPVSDHFSPVFPHFSRANHLSLVPRYLTPDRTDPTLLTLGPRAHLDLCDLISAVAVRGECTVCQVPVVRGAACARRACGCAMHDTCAARWFGDRDGNGRVCASCGEPWLTADERMTGVPVSVPVPLSLSQASDSSGSGSGSGTSGAAAARSRKRSRR